MINRIEGNTALGQRSRVKVKPGLLGSTGGLASLWRSLETTIADQPKSSLLAALSAGVLLGWLIKRH